MQAVMLSEFQHTAARRRLETISKRLRQILLFQHTAARRRLALIWVGVIKKSEFQHTAARRRLVRSSAREVPPYIVSTHSRPKAAGEWATTQVILMIVSTHSRPKAAGIGCIGLFGNDRVSTHSRPKAAGGEDVIHVMQPNLFQHTAARRRLDGLNVRFF